jgi:hypothetical protein
MRPSKWEGEAIDMVEMLTRRLQIIARASDKQWDSLSLSRSLTQETIREALDFLRRYDDREEWRRSWER